MNPVAPPDAEAAPAQDLVDAILSVLRERTGCDFSRYRPATVQRRIQNRMITLGVASLPEYLARLERTEEESRQLLERLTIKVSWFYRNPATFDLLRARILPELARGGQPVRIWSAGCGCGEEAYTLAMLLEEAALPGTVVGSDIDPAALAAARNGVYPGRALAQLPPALRQRFLQPLSGGESGRYQVCARVRARVRFRQHDLTAPATPPAEGKFDLVACRNVLIYLQRDAQARVLQRLCRSLEPGRFLCLGEAEWPRARGSYRLVPFGRKTHLFRVLREVVHGVRP